MNTREYLNEVMRVKGISSDYALAKVLGVGKQTISGYRNKNTTMHNDVAVKVAEALGLHPGIVLIDMQAERTKDPAMRTLWEGIGAGFPALSLQANVFGEALPA